MIKRVMKFSYLLLAIIIFSCSLFFAKNNKDRKNDFSDNKSIKEYKITYLLSGFNEGLAWVETGFGSMGSYNVVLINKKGQVVYEVGYSKNIVITTPFVNGLSAVYYTDGSNANKSIQGFKIINKYGKVVYETSDLYFCGRTDDGIFISAQNQSGFSGVKWEIVTIDDKLNLTNTGIVVDETIIYNSFSDNFKNEKQKHQSNRIITFEKGVYYTEEWLININKGIAIQIPYENRFTYQFGSYCYFGNSNHDLSGRVVTEQLYIDAESIDDINGNSKQFLEKHTIMHIPKEWLNIGSKIDFLDFNNGTILVQKRNKNNNDFLNVKYDECLIYDLRENVVVSFPQLPEGASYGKFCDYSNGSIVAFLTGADKKGYVTVFDEKGKMLYEPVLIDEYPNYYLTREGYIGFNGYAFTHEGIITNSLGKYMQKGANLSDLNNGENFNYIYNSTNSLRVFISDGFIYYGTNDIKLLQSLDGKNIIKELTTTYDEKGNLIFDKNIIK